MEHKEYSVGAAGPYFQPFRDPSTTAEQWKTWMRNFNYYIDGQIGLSDKQKVARLLHQAGPEVQEIYESLAENDAEGNNEFEKCVYRLNSYFEPRSNAAYERQKFRNITMEKDENVDQFVLRLRKQARYCEFLDVEEVLRDQLIEKCINLDLKRKFLKKGRDLTLKSALEIARIYEIEKIMFVEKPKEVNENADVNIINISCFRCGRKGHMAKDNTCPALYEKCDKCGLKGHFSKCCKTKGKYYAASSSKKKNGDYKKKKRYVKYVIEDGSSSDSSDNSDSVCEKETEVNSVYEVSGSASNKCNIQVGDKTLCRFIIDSGASINIIDKHTFKKLNKSGLEYKLNVGITQKYFSYGGKEIPKIGIFNTSLYSPDSKVKTNADILVYNGCGPSLLSRQTSEKLGLLRLGPVSNKYCVNSVDESCMPITKELVKKEYPKLFEGVGKLINFKLKIPVDPDVKLIAQPIRRQPFNVRDIEQRLINELLDNDIIEPVTGPTPCVSPSHIVKKKEKDQYRLVVDMRKANEAVMRERVPLPTFEELLADLNECKYFSSIDIKWGYHQIELEEESRGITVFSSSLGLFRYKRLFFGIRCASEMFQRVIAHLLQGIDGVANSQDDIRIGGRTVEEHNNRLKQVLDKLHKNGITLNERKCSFGATEINFLGHHLSAEGVRPTASNQKVVQEFRAPANKAQVRSFLGLINFSARFIPDCGTLTEPLRELIKKDSEFSWTKAHEQAFQKLKDHIAKAPALGYYDKNAETTLVTDASPVGIAGVLIQHQHINGEYQPVVIKYISKALSETEQRYSQTEKEALAIVWACENLYMYLLGKNFVIQSDHKPLEIIYSSNSKPSARIQRWVLRLQPFTFKVKYKPGKTNIADPVSRLLDTSNKSQMKTEDNEDVLLLAFIEQSVKAVTIKEIQEATTVDEELIKLKNAIQTDVWSKELRKYELIKSELCTVDGVILRGTRLVIPKKLVPRILESAHEGHLSINSMKARLRSKVWWKGLDKDVEYWIDTCEGCRLVRQNIHPEPLIPTELPIRVWQLVAIDYLGPLPSGHYLFFIIDYYSRYFEVEILNNQTADTTIKTLEKIIAREGIMEELICDNGPAFKDKRFKDFLETNNIKLRHTTPLWPQANGEVERQNRNVLRRLKIAQGLKQDWKRELLVYLMAYRTTPHSSTGLPPGNIFRGRNIRCKIPEIALEPNFENEEMKDKDRYSKDRFKQYADKKRHAKTSDIQPGDKVLVKQRKENKLSTTFSPAEHTVVWKRGNSVTAQSPDGNIVHRNSSYFQPVLERRMSRFDEQTEGKEKEDEEEPILQIPPDMSKKHNTDKVTNSDLTNKDLTNNNRSQRTRQIPNKYKDFVLGLILDCI